MYELGHNPYVPDGASSVADGWEVFPNDAVSACSVHDIVETLPIADAVIAAPVPAAPAAVLVAPAAALAAPAAPPPTPAAPAAPASPPPAPTAPAAATAAPAAAGAAVDGYTEIQQII